MSSLTNKIKRLTISLTMSSNRVICIGIIIAILLISQVTFSQQFNFTQQFSYRHIGLEEGLPDIRIRLPAKSDVDLENPTINNFLKDI